MDQDHTQPSQTTKSAVVEALRRLLDDLESGKLRDGGWRAQFVASAIGLLASGCYEEAATHAAQARSGAAICTKQAAPGDLLRGLESVA